MPSSSRRSDERHLGVGLEADHAVDDLRADRLEPLGERDVGFLVEARLQFDDDRDFLAAPRRLHQQVDEDRARASAVQRHADRDHLGVERGLAQELDHRLEALERMVQQHVAAADRVEHVGAAGEIGQAARQSGHEQRPAQLRRGELVDELVEAHEVDRAVDAEHRLVRQPELLAQQASRGAADRCAGSRAGRRCRNGAASAPCAAPGAGCGPRARRPTGPSPGSRGTARNRRRCVRETRPRDARGSPKTAARTPACAAPASPAQESRAAARAAP